MLLRNRQLDAAQLNDLNKLIERCQSHDGGIPSVYPHLLSQLRDNESNVLYYEEDQLLGFLSVYFFYEKACEISLFIAPSHRKKGLAMELLKTIVPLLQTKSMESVIFSTAESFQSTWIPPKHFTYKQSEYHMERHSFAPQLIINPLLSLRKATIRDLEVLVAMDSTCFPEQQNNALDHLLYVLNDNNYTILLGLLDDLVIGKTHIHWLDTELTFSDIAILPEYQGKGFGSELLAHCINYALEHGKALLELDVEAKNKSALNLYLKHGFKTTKVYDYWEVSLAALTQLLSKRSAAV